MRIYIAHPYTGDEEKNRERALRAEGLLRKATASYFAATGKRAQDAASKCRWHSG